MGEIADLMLSGALCEMCGGFVSDSPPGYPQYCSPECAKDRNATYVEPITVTKPFLAYKPKPKVECPVCKRKVKKQGLPQHLKDVHKMDKPPQK